MADEKKEARVAVFSKENLPPDLMKKLAEKHIDRYSKLIEDGARGDRSVSFQECYYLIGIWTRMARRPDYTKLTKAELMELSHALMDGEHREFLGGTPS